MNFSQFKQSFFHNRTDKRRLVNNIKTFCANYKELSKFVERYQKDLRSATSLLNSAILGKNHLPKAYEELGVSDSYYFTDSLEKEMNWQVLAFIESSAIINKFIQLKNKYEHNLLLGNYEHSRLLLDEIESEVCISYWSIENRFIIDEYQFGSEKNWETRNKVLDEKNDAFVQVFGSFTSFKIEKNVSFFQYNVEFNSWQEQEGLNRNNEFAGIIEYFRYKGNFYSYSKYKHLSEILYKESNASIIDRYILFIRIAQHFISEQPEENSFIVVLLQELHEKIDDISLKQMLLASDNSYILNNEDINFEIIHILDEYTKGNYNSSKDLSKAYLLNYSSFYLELLEIYSKSIVELNQDYEPITQNESFLNQIASYYFNILSKNTNTDNSLVELVKLSYIFNNSHIGLHLYSFISEQLGWESAINYEFLENLNSRFINPQLVLNLYQKEFQAKTYINNLKNTIKDSITVNLYSQFYLNFISTQLNEHFENVADNKNFLYKIRSLMLKGLTDECIEICKNLLKSKKLSITIYYEIVSYLFSCYLKKEDYRNAIILFVETHLKNQHLTKKMAVDELNNIIIKSKFKNVGDKSTLIELPILLKISNVDKIKVKQSYELFLNGNIVNKPSELLGIPNHFDLDKLFFFFKYVCIPEIMQLSKFFNSSYEVNEERIIITKYLATIDNDDSYKNEIAELTQKNTISKVIGNW
ncbi:hypothetical protein [Emticicia sp. SJ17W-69]|uniref:hypothetical protein n=1 Tax=Emticicia sp. SJ17W-69 TaxID=3421657 RepID=UPI003EBCB48D